MMTRRTYSNLSGNESGFTLIELVIGGLVALMVVAGIVATMTMSQRNYFVQDRVSEAQQGGRIGLDLVARDTRLAGLGFPRGTATKLFYYAPASGAAIAGLPGGAPANLVANNAPGGAGAIQLAGTDAIAIKSILTDSSNDAPIRVIKHPAPPAVTMQLEKPTAPATAPAAGDILLCETTDGQFDTICVSTVTTAPPNFDLITGNHGGAGTCPQGFNSPGGPGADYTNGQCSKIQSGRTTTSVYYVADATVAGSPPVGRLMFWNGDGNVNPVVVANDVEDFQVAYCTNCDTVPVWTSAPTAADDANIRTVTLNVVTRTAAQDPKFSSSPASVAATTPTPGFLVDHPLSNTLDGFRRRLLTTTVQVRNNTLN